MANDLIISLLTEFRNKAGCVYTKNKARNSLLKLKTLLQPREIQLLSIASNHHSLGEGREELDEVCNKLLVKYGES